MRAAGEIVKGAGPDCNVGRCCSDVLAATSRERRHATSSERTATALRALAEDRRRRPPEIELKFNHNHDPRNGQFTFGPGGESGSTMSRHDPLHQSVSQTRPVPEPYNRGSNRPFGDPMTLAEAFPGLQHAPGGAIIAVADSMLGISGPANEFLQARLTEQTKSLKAEIKALDPTWHYDAISPTDAFGNEIVTIEGLTNTVNSLRFQRAATYARLKGDYGPLKVETLRFIQQRANIAYDEGEALLKAGKLKPRLSEPEALGNHIDGRVRRELRIQYSQYGIESSGKGPARVNRRENDTSGNDRTYRRPDARVQDVAFDVTLTAKTLATAQVRGFFNTDFRPSQVVIIRPSQLGADHTYIISRPETK